MKTQYFKSQQRQLLNGAKLYGRQWLAMSSRPAPSDAYVTQKTLWPVYI